MLSLAMKTALPGGKYKNMDLMDMFEGLRQDHGDIFLMPGVMGAPTFVMTSNPNDFEIVFRNEGIWPHRPGSDSLRYHRDEKRKDFYQGVSGLIPSQGKAWGTFDLLSTRS